MGKKNILITMQPRMAQLFENCGHAMMKILAAVLMMAIDGRAFRSTAILSTFRAPCSSLSPFPVLRSRHETSRVYHVGMSAQGETDKKFDPFAGFLKVLDASLTAVGAAPIDYRKPDERPAEAKQAPIEDVAPPVEEPDFVSPQLISALDRLKVLLSSEEELTPECARELDSLHLLVLSDLVSSVKDARPFLTNRNLTLPAAHIMTRDGTLSSSLKWIPKKLGLNPLMSRVAKDSSAASGATASANTRELAALCRDIERAVSETIVVSGTCAMLPDDGTRTDFLETIRPMLEHTPAKSRHQTLMAVSGFFRAVSEQAGGEALAPFRRPFPTISSSWKMLMPKDFTCGTWPARAALPFLLAAARNDAILHTQSVEAALEAVAAADAACVHVIARLLEADTSGYTLGGLQRCVASHCVQGDVQVAIRIAGDDDASTVKEALTAKMLLVAEDAGWNGSSYVSALRNELVSEVTASIELSDARKRLLTQVFGAPVLLPRSPRLPSDMYRLLLRAVYAAPSGLRGAPLVRSVNAVACCTALAKVDSGTVALLEQLAARSLSKGDELLQRVREVLVQRVAVVLLGDKAWRLKQEGEKQSVLQAIRRALYGKEGEGGVSGEGGEGGEGGVLWEWRQGHLLLELYAILADDASAEPLVRRLLLTLFQMGERGSVEEERFANTDNRKHLEALDAGVVRKWAALSNAPFGHAPPASPTASLGTSDLETMLMMGEDMRTCMAIEPSNKRTLKGLLAYLTAANARLLCTSPLLPPAPRGTSRDTPPSTSAPEVAAAGGGARSLSTPPPPSQSVTPPRLFDGQGGRRGKWRARSVARLLLRRDTRQTVLFVDRPYFEGAPDPQAAAELQGQAQELASYLGVPLFFPRESPPEVKEVEAFKVPATSDVYPYGVIELVDVGGAAPFVWRDGRFQVGLVFRGQVGETVVRTSLGGDQVAVGILFGGWADSLEEYERSLGKEGSAPSSTTTVMREVQQIGAALATEARSSRTLSRQKKKNPWDLQF